MSSEKNNGASKPDKKKMQTTQQIFHILLELTELYPEYTICQHLAGIVRKKKPDVKEFYYWSNEQLLKRIESYKQELEKDSLSDDETE
jgi:hypothetical protein